ncbi:hypothetical protein F0562_025197 [Nyssa sinensis]|uniref:Uncharacterized protein n=1 Tax=Nyssa sinensis TaxID=561372 RepID=A0A5J5BEX7_9ASTE|nr:hypothetical protein F0562_025197 [Nyssa sinensis]
MSSFIFATLFVLLGALWAFINLRWARAPAASLPPTNWKNNRKLPPGPRALPIIGNLHMLGKLPHRTLQELAKKYGPLMSMRLGYMPTIVISSPLAAELFLKIHDSVFASQPKVQAADYLSYGTKGMAFTKYGPYWRNVRKFCTHELLSAAKIDSFKAMRREELESLVQSLMEAAKAHEVVDVSEKSIVHQALSLVAAPNLADYVPFLGAFDLQGLTRHFKETSKALDKILEIIIEEHVQEANSGQQRNNHEMDFVDVMLSLMKKSTNTHDGLSSIIDRTSIKAIILDMIVGTIDTSATAIEWVLSELLRHPRVMRQVQEELNSVVGMDRSIVEETDLAKLNYLDMVIKESLRLPPVAPLLIPRESVEDIVIGEYYIPKKSRIIVNCWALGRDSEVWSKNVEEFLPKRFKGSDIDLKGCDFQLIPFGSGRRGCPGMNLGLLNIRLVVAQLVHCFHWELPNGMSTAEMDMAEKFDLSSPRAKHLLAVPKYCLGV